MNKTEQHIFFHLLRTALWQREPDATPFQSEDWQWRNILIALDNHALLALAADAIMTINDMLPASKQLNPMQSMNLMQHCASVAQTHYDLNAAVIKSFVQLQQAGCTPILLKGQGLATLYPIKNTRSCGDIDIYVGKQQFTKACHVIDEYCGNPYHEEEVQDGDIHYKTSIGNIEFEIHHSASYTSIPSIWDEYNQWAAEWLVPEKCMQTDISDTKVATPPYQFYVIYIFEHLLKHLRYEGVGVRQFIDWAMLLYNAMNTSALSVPTLEKDLRRFHLLDAWQVLGGILVYQIGLPKDKFPLWKERKARQSQGKNLDFIVECGNFGENITANREFANMPPSMHRNLLAFKHYLSRLQFEYQLLPWDTPRRFFRQLKARLKEIK